MQLSSPRPRRALPLVIAVVLSLMMPPALPQKAFAQDDDSAQAAQPAPGPVARIDALSGDVAIQRGDDNSTLAAVANAPVLGADYVTTGQDGRAEVGFDGRSAVRLGENVQIRFVNVDPANREMQLAAGTIELRLFGDTDGQSAIDTPSISVIPRTAGSFRVSVDANGETAVTVRAGRADVVTPQGNQSLEPGSTLIADGPAANPQIQTQAAIALDDFDSYNGDRDHIYLAASAEGQYVDPSIQGVGDLAASGNWVDDSTYGNVWIPTNVAADWAPYRNGNWVWEDGYGWTWVAAEPWGWAPYHYGRWYFSTAYHHWAWYPPAPGRRAPAWSPALVGFVGFNIGAVSVGIGFGNIGWVPLAPYETFHPWWGPHATAIVNGNVHFRNIAVNGAFTSVTRENFQNGRFGNPTVVSATQLRTIQTVPVQGALPIVPSQANLRFTQRAVAPSLAARPQFTNRSFAGAQGGFAARTPFTTQQASVARVTHVAYHPQTPGGAVAPSYGNDTWSRFNANRSNATGGNMPPYARQGSVPNAQPQYNRQSAPGYAQPQYSRQSAPGYAQPQYNRQSTPGYAQPQYNRQSTPAFTRPAAPAYNRPGAPAYSRPAPVAHPQTHATHASDDHHHN
jgi:hypothetical protein